jgi:hypothetical protein
MTTSNIHVTYDFSLPQHRVAFPQEQKFHRIMKFGEHGLQGIVKEKALTFVSYDRWTDSHEAYLIQALRTLEGEKLLERVFAKLGYQQNARLFRAMIQAGKRGRHMQSWTCGPESEEMWRIYSPERQCVRVQTSALKVWNSKIEALPIVYVPKLSVEEEIKRLLSDGGHCMDFINIFTRKLKRFSFEQEVRFISEDVFAFPDSNSGVVPGKEYLRKVDISHIPDFIESVVVDPEATPSFVNEVERFCNANNIPFGGQSDLNKFKLE